MDLDPRLRPARGDRSSMGLGFGLGAAATTTTSRLTATPSPSGAVAADADTRNSSNGNQHRYPPPPGSQDHEDEDEEEEDDDDHDNDDHPAENDGGQQQGADGSAAEIKRSRACEACRGLKVRCEPDPSEQGPCKRCKKAGRKCVVTAPSRKRQKKTDSRVSELEKKIDALTASLQARGGSGAGGHDSASNASGTIAAVAHHEYGVSPSSATVQGVSRSSADEASPQNIRSSWSNNGGDGAIGRHNTTSAPPHQPAPRRDTVPAFQPPMVMAGQKRKASGRGSTDDDRRHSPKTGGSSPSPWTRPQDGDIVERGLISMDKAAELFARYCDDMVPHIPAILFPPNMTVSELRRTKPTLFHAIMAAAANEMGNLHKTLQRELLQILAEKMMLTGEKSLELVQALLISVFWYFPPEHMEELKFYQLVHMAAVLAIDIGLGRRPPSGRRGPGFGGGGGFASWNAHPFRRGATLDPLSLESRRTWLACYYLTSNTAMALHRPNLVRWTSFMTECVDILTTSRDAAATDKYFCHLVWTHRHSEEVGEQFSMDDSTVNIDLNNPRVQYSLKALERDMERYKNNVPEELMQPTLKISFNMVSLYMHEVALQTMTGTDQFRPPFNTDTFKSGVSNGPLSPVHFSSISACLSAVDGLFNTFLSLDVASIRCLPVFNFVRVAYGVVILIKLYFSAANPDSDLGKVIGKENLRVEYYLNALLEKFRVVAADDKCRPASKFLVVMAMLRSWFSKQGVALPSGIGQTPSSTGGGNNNHNNNNDGNGRPLSPPASRSNPSYLQQQPPPANTPLQLLSEVATGGGSNSNGGDLSNGTYPGLDARSCVRQPAQPFFHQDDASSNFTTSSSTNTVGPGGPYAALPPLSDPAVSGSVSAWGSPGGGGVAAGLGMDMMMNLGDIGLGPQDFSFGNMALNEGWLTDVMQGMGSPGTLFQF